MLIAGAQGFAKELLTVFMEQDHITDWTFFDDVTPDIGDKLYNRFDILRNEEEVLSYFSSFNKDFALGVGSPAGRVALYNKLSKLGGELKSIISARAVIGHFQNELSEGITVMPNAIIENENTIGKGVLVHAGAFISHECIIGEFAEISPAAQLLGKVTVGKFCSIGAGAILLPGIKTGDNVVIGAGAVVTKDIPANAVVAGIPARELTSKNTSEIK